MDFRRGSRRISAAVLLLLLCLLLPNPPFPASPTLSRRSAAASSPSTTLILRRRLHPSAASSSRGLKLRVVHRLSPQFRRIADEIRHLVMSDKLRMTEFRLTIRSASSLSGRAAGHIRNGAGSPGLPLNSSSSSPSSALPPGSSAASPPPYSTTYKELEGRVFSGAFFPGNVGQYFVEFSVGTPSQSFFFIIDTGSDLLWVPCSLDSCNGTAAAGDGCSSAVFRADRSSSFAPIACSAGECELIPPPIDAASCSSAAPTACTYAYRYSDSSTTTGVFGYDTVTLHMAASNNASYGAGDVVSDSVSIGTVALGCGTNNTGPSITNIGGVLGLGQGPISFASQVGYLYGSAFSYCFTSFFNARNSSSSLRFGRREAAPPPPLRAALQSTPFVRNPVVDTFYYVGIESVRVDGEDIGVPPEVWQLAADGSGAGGAVIDSGTTLTFFPEPAYDMITTAVDGAMKRFSYAAAPAAAGLTLCYGKGANNGTRRLPRLAIVLKGGAVFAPPPRNYFLEPEVGLLCLGLVMGEEGTPTVLGNLLQQNMYVEYDRKEGRLSFARAYCADSAEA